MHDDVSLIKHLNNCRLPHVIAIYVKKKKKIYIYIQHLKQNWQPAFAKKEKKIQTTQEIKRTFFLIGRYKTKTSSVICTFCSVSCNLRISSFANERHYVLVNILFGITTLALAPLLCLSVCGSYGWRARQHKVCCFSDWLKMFGNLDWWTARNYLLLWFHGMNYMWGGRKLPVVFRTYN